MRNIVIAAGGTGGHIFPALAVAKVCLELMPDCKISWIGKREGRELSIAKDNGFKTFGASLHGISRDEPWRNIDLIYRLPLELARAIAFIKSVSPEVVLSFGGYIGGLGALAALASGVPLVIHEQNAYPGLVTRVLARRACAVCTSFPVTESFLPLGTNVVLTGLPIRKGFVPAVRRDVRYLLVFGGSQGASKINRVMFDGLESILSRFDDLKIIHICGDLDSQRCMGKASSLSTIFRGRYSWFAFVDDMPGVMNRADLALCRSGASTCAELVASGMPSILVPYPYAGGHQRFNAMELQKVGAATVIPDNQLSVKSIIDALDDLVSNPDKVEAMSKAAIRLSMPEAAANVVTVLNRVVAK